MSHIMLLGDSIFDNGAYTLGEPDVVSHLRRRLPAPWRATLLAVDGATTASIPEQIARTPPDASHLVLAVGGNDALMNQDLLSTPVRSSAETLALFARRVAQFEAAYRRAVDAVAALGRETTICTIYNGNFDEPQATLARVALTTFNDVILRVGFERALTVIELRLVCDMREDYANPIEPSGRGGEKIAAAIASAVGAVERVRFSRVVSRAREAL
jgi:GDSL-like Lipase/Acylhydrolase family